LSWIVLIKLGCGFWSRVVNQWYALAFYSIISHGPTLCSTRSVIKDGDTLGYLGI
jgi:hypothetical protein